MKEELKYALYMLALGASLVAYAHGQFATKSRVERIEDKLNQIDERIYQIWEKVVQQPRGR